MDKSTKISTETATLLLLLMLIALVAMAPSAWAQPPAIKKSDSGICHPPESRYFERTGNFQPFVSLQSCLDSGGRLPANLPRSAVKESEAPRRQPWDAPKVSISRYERSKFGHGWGDNDGDCQNSRVEALISTSTAPVRFADERRCHVVSGRWISPFTGDVIQNSSDIDIDHVVPLKWAWDHGAFSWNPDQRERFANDLANLIPVETSLNRSKAAQGPDDWLPPSNQCEYVTRFIRLVRIYNLTATQKEERFFQSTLDSCR